jgi:hypothetical protein
MNDNSGGNIQNNISSFTSRLPPTNQEATNNHPRNGSTCSSARQRTNIMG